MKKLFDNRKKSIGWYDWLIWFTFIFTAVYASSLPGINIFGALNLYPFRILLIFGIAALVLGSRRKHPIIKQIRIVFLFALLYGIIELVWCIDKMQTVKYLVNYIFMWVFIEILFCAIKTPTMLKNTLLIIGGILFMLQIMGLLEGITGRYFFSVDPKWNSTLNERGFYSPITVFGNPNDFVFVLISFMPLFFCVVNNLTHNGGIKFVLRTGYILLTLLLSYFGQCRMGFLGIAIVLYFYALLGKRKKAVMLGTVIFACAALFAIPVIVEKLSAESRIKIWIDHFKIAEHFGFMGAGAGNSFIRIPGIKYLEDPINAHFWFLEIFVEFGVFIFAAVMWFYFGLLRKTYKTYRKNKKNYYVKAAFVSLMAFLPLSIMSSSISITPWFYLMIGLIIAINIIYARQNTRGANGRKKANG